MNIRLAAVVAALALSATAFAQDAAMNRPEERVAAGGMTNEAARGPLKTVKCDAPCDFEVRGHDEKELIQIVKAHAKGKHKMTITDKQVRDKMTTEPAGTTTETPR